MSYPSPDKAPGKPRLPPAETPMTKDSQSKSPEAEQPHADLQPLFGAIGQGDAKSIRAMIQEDPGLIDKCNAEGLSPIVWAYYNKKPELAQLLRDAGAAMGAFEMCVMDEREGLQAMLEADADALTSRVIGGFTLLHMAAFFGRGEIVELLLSSGAEVDAISNDVDKATPLHAAAASTAITSAIKLLNAGAAPDALQKGGYTALMSAAAMGSQSMANALLKAGAELGRKAEDGRTALDIAKAAGHKKLVNFLSMQ